MLGCEDPPRPVDPASIPAPITRAVPRKLSKHGHTRTDDYYWLKERDSAEVVAYLEAENSYLEKIMAHTAGLREKLFEEIVGRIKKNDETVPYRRDGYYYYARFDEDSEYPIFCRKKGSLASPEEKLIDGNERARGHDFYSVHGLKVSSGRDILAFAEDTVGRRIFTLRFKNLPTGEILGDEIPHVTGNHAWAEDGRTLFYTKQHPETLRWYQIWRHELGSDSSRDVLVYEEKDEEYESWIFKTKSRRFLIVASNQTLSNEYRYLDARNPAGEFRMILPREKEHEYSVDHLGEHFFIRTNWQAKNFRLVKTPIDRTDKSNWVDVVEHRDDVLIESFDVFLDLSFLIIDPGGTPYPMGGATSVWNSGQVGRGRHEPVDQRFSLGIRDRECGRRNGKEIHGRKSVLVVAQERGLTLQLGVIIGTTRHVTRHRYRRDDGSELHQLAVDARCTPAVSCHSPYEAANLSVNPRPPRALLLLGDLRPVASESISIPLDDGVRVYDDQSGPPARPRRVQGDPESAVDIIEHRPWSLLFQRGHLLPQRQVLDQKFLARTKDGSEGMDAECHEEDE